MPNPPLRVPSGYATLNSIGVLAPDGTVVPVSSDFPLPVSSDGSAVVLPSALTGSATGTVTSAPFSPAPGKAVTVVLKGTWTGSVSVTRSSDGGATRQPLTLGGQPWGRFTGNACEQVWEEPTANAQLYLEIAVTSGTLNYRLEH